MTAPTLVLVPGLWEGPTVYDSLREILAKATPPLTDCHAAPLRSTGTTTPGNPTMLDDIRGIREVVEPLVQAGKRVVVVAHSAGGFLGSAAVEGLEVGGKDTKASGGGVEKMFFIAAGIAPAGTQHRPQPFMDFQGDKMFCKDPDSRLFNDVPADVAARYKPRLQCQPAGNWDSAIPYAGWDKIPSAYLLCEKDACLLPDVQRHMAEAAKCHIITASLGHMAMLVDPGQVAEKLLAFIRA